MTCFYGKGTHSGYKAATATQAKQLSLVSSYNKPFTGKVFYLDLPSNKTAESLESDIKELGGVRGFRFLGCIDDIKRFEISKNIVIILFHVFPTQTVEKFFSKEIKYLVSNKKEARYVNCLRQPSPVPSRDSGQSSSHPGSNLHKPCSHGDNVKGRSLNQTDTVSCVYKPIKQKCPHVSRM